MIAVVIMAGWLAMVQLVGDGGMAGGQTSRAAAREFEAKLAALTPERWGDYFRLAEDVADGAEGSPEAPDRLRLVRELYVLAFALAGDGRADGGGVGRAGPLIGLASLEERASTRRWLLSLAAGIDPRHASPGWGGSSQGVSGDVALRAATAIGQARAGDGREARRLMNEPGVRELLARYERAIGDTGQLGALSRLEQYAAAWPCPECGNQRVVTRSGGQGTRTTLCPTCGGNPGPKLGRAETVAQLRFEAMLLAPRGGLQRSWAAELLVDGGAPLRDPEAADVPGVYGVDVSKACWRAGVGWVECGGAKETTGGGTTVVPNVVPKAAPPVSPGVGGPTKD